ncbi:MAG: hypothetical protein AT710_07740 [Thermocladium sp. ECH_B]|nr:MAG: hypothetical protein AT710_07740 [Thermocladium sp. ECH_B]
MYIKFYTISERFDEYEKSLKSLVENLRNQLSKMGENPDKVKLTIVKVKPETAAETAKYVGEKEERKIPPQLRYLISALRQDGIMMLPAMVINNKKIFEGEPMPMDQITTIILNEARTEFSIELQPQKAAQQSPQPQQQLPPPPPPPTQPQQQLPVSPPPPQPQLPPPPQLPLLPLPPVSPPPPQPQLPPPPTQPQQPLLDLMGQQSSRQSAVEGALRGVTVTGFKLVMGRPDNCNDCIYYGSTRGRCLLFGFKVGDPTHPPCKSPGLN